MIKAKGAQHVILGLSDKNLEYLKQDRPVVFDGAEIGIPGKTFIIMWGETELHIQDKLVQAGLLPEGNKQ